MKGRVGVPKKMNVQFYVQPRHYFILLPLSIVQDIKFVYKTEETVYVKSFFTYTKCRHFSFTSWIIMNELPKTKEMV